MGNLDIVTTSSDTAFSRSAETVYDFVTTPANWTKTYPGSAHISDLPDVPLKVGDTFTRTMTIEAYKDDPLSDAFFRIVNPANIDAYHAAVERELG